MGSVVISQAMASASSADMAPAASSTEEGDFGGDCVGVALLFVGGW